MRCLHPVRSQVACRSAAHAGPPAGLTTGDRPLADQPADRPQTGRGAAARHRGGLGVRTEQAAARVRRPSAAAPTVTWDRLRPSRTGQIQDVNGNIVGTSKGASTAGPAHPLVSRCPTRSWRPLRPGRCCGARSRRRTSRRNDSLLAGGGGVLQRGAGARRPGRGRGGGPRQTADLVGRAEDLARKGEIIPELEVVRALRPGRTQPARRCRQAGAGGAWPAPTWPACCGWTPRPWWSRSSCPTSASPSCSPGPAGGRPHPHRPDATSGRAGQPAGVVQATLERLRQERLQAVDPKHPHPRLVHAGHRHAGRGRFWRRGERRSQPFGARSDIDVQVLWELRNLGFGNRGWWTSSGPRARWPSWSCSCIEVRAPAEWRGAGGGAVRAHARVSDAEAGLRDAADSANKNVQGLGQTKSAGGNLLVLVIRPQEAVAAVQALAQAYTDYYAAVADFDRAQFRLYRALGDPGQALAGAAEACTPPGADPTPPQ